MSIKVALLILTLLVYAHTGLKPDLPMLAKKRTMVPIQFE